jgi:FMN reductase
VLAALGARHILDAVYAVDAQFVPHAVHGHVAHDDVVRRIDRALAEAPVALRAAADGSARPVALAA